jgi:hypothetical protein
MMSSFSSDDYNDTTDLRDQITQRIVEYESLLNDLDDYESLCKFGEFLRFGREFLKDVDWLRDVWLDDEPTIFFDARRVAEVEDKLVQLPFELAFYKRHADDFTHYPAFDDQVSQEILARKFGEDVEWRFKPEIVMTMSREDKLRIHSNFEYMCCFVINAREELIFDIRDRILG